MLVTLKVGQTVVVHSNPKDAFGNGPALIQPGTLGNTGTQWFPQTGGIVTKSEQGIEGADCQFTAVAPGSTAVIIQAKSLSGITKMTSFDITVQVGELDHFEPVAETPVG
jgi:hypothetical protein